MSIISERQASIDFSASTHVDVIDPDLMIVEELGDRTPCASSQSLHRNDYRTPTATSRFAGLENTGKIGRVFSPVARMTFNGGHNEIEDSAKSLNCLERVKGKYALAPQTLK